MLKTFWISMFWKFYVVVVVVAKSGPTLCDPMDCSTPGFPVLHHLPVFVQTHVPCVGDAIQPSHALSSPSPPAFNLTQHQGLFKWVSCSHQGPKYWSFSFNISTSNEHPGLISFRMDWFDPLPSKGPSRVLQHHSSEASLLWCLAFFTVQLSHPYVTTGKTKALTQRTFIGRVMSLLFNMLFSEVSSSFSSKEPVSFNFMAAVTIHSDFWSPRK